MYGDVKVTSLSDNQYADFTIRALTLEKVCSLISFSTQKHNPQAQKSKVRRQKSRKKMIYYHHVVLVDIAIFIIIDFSITI